MDERGQFPRARGPFEGARLAMLDIEVRIYDLSAGGCFVDSMVEARAGESVRLRIDLPDAGPIQVSGRVVPSTRTLGYAVRFSAYEGDAREQLEQTVARLAFTRRSDNR